MSKTERIILIVALAMLPVGIIIAVLGFRFGGKASWSVNLADNKVNSSAAIVEDTVDLEEFDSLTVDISSMDMNIVTGDSYQLHYRAMEGNEPVVGRKGGELSISQPERFNFMMFNFDSQNEYYELTVPKGTKIYPLNFKASSGDTRIEGVPVSGMIKLTSGELYVGGFDTTDLNMELSSGEVHFDKINLNNMDVKMTSGEFYLNDSAMKRLSLEASSGDYRISNVKADEITGILTSGDIEMSDVEAAKIDARMSSGEITMDLIGKADDYDYSISLTSGDIEINGEDIEHKYVKDTGNDKKIAVKATSGDVEINFR